MGGGHPSLLLFGGRLFPVEDVDVLLLLFPELVTLTLISEHLYGGGNFGAGRDNRRLHSILGVWRRGTLAICLLFSRKESSLTVVIGCVVLGVILCCVAARPLAHLKLAFFKIGRLLYKGHRVRKSEDLLSIGGLFDRATGP